MCITADNVNINFEYDAVSGNLYRKLGTRRKLLSNKDTRGYIHFMFDYKRYLAHRIIFLIMRGAIPKAVDHINGTKTDNRWVNLRDVTTSENSCNTKLRSDNSTGVKGIRYTESGVRRYIAQVNLAGKQYSKTFTISKFNSKEHALEEAKNFIEALRRDLHKEYANHG
jgi:hypothetical protein